MATEVERLTVTLEAKLDKYASDLRRAATVTDQRLEAMEKSYRELAATARVSSAAAAQAASTIATGSTQFARAAIATQTLTTGVGNFGRAALEAQLANERLIAGMSRHNQVHAPDYIAKTEEATKKTRDYGRSLDALDALDGRGVRRTSDEIDHLGGSLRRNRGEMKASTSAFAAFVAESTGFGTAVTGIGLNIAGLQLLEYANAWKQVTRSIDAGQQTFGVALKDASSLTTLANEARVDLDAYSQLFIRTTAAIRDYGMGAETAAVVTSTLSKALKLGSASASEQASVLLQFSQALQKGKLDGDEFRSVMENAGVVQELLAERLRVSKGEIITMAAEGKLKVRDLVGAMVDGADKVDRIFKGMPATIDEAFAVMRNNVIRYIGQVDESTGATNALASAMGNLATHIDDVAAAAAILGAAILTAFAPRAIVGIAALATRLLSLPALLGGVSAAALTLGSDVTINFDRMNQALAQGADLSTALEVAMRENSATATTLADQFRGLATVIGQDLASAIDGINQSITGQQTNWDQLRVYALMAIGGVVGGLKSLGQLAYAGLTVIPKVGKLAFQELYNGVASTMQAIIDTFASAINRLIDLANNIPGVKLDFVVAPEIDKADTDKTRAELEAISKDLQAKLTENFDLKGFASRVQKEADKVAFDRAVGRFKPSSPFNPKQGKPPPDVDKDAERARARFEKDLLRAEAAVQMQKLEAESIGRSTFETEKLRVQTQLLNEAREAGIALSKEDKIRIDAIANATAFAAVQVENMRAAYSLMADESKQFLSDFAKGMVKGQSATELLANGLDRIADKLLDMAVNDLVDGALGGLLGRGGPQSGQSGVGLVSGFASLFGFAKGGVMVPGQGPASLPRFAKGGVSRSAAVFGEGPMAEAAVPLPDGRRIPVDLRLPDVPRANAPAVSSPSVTMQLNIDARGATAEGVKALQGDLVPTIQKVVRNEVNEMFTRTSRFARAG